MARERVAVLHCPATASDDAVRAAVFRAAELVGDSVQRGNGPADVPRTGNSRLHGYYERVREQEQIRRDRRAKRRAASEWLNWSSGIPVTSFTSSTDRPQK